MTEDISLINREGTQVRKIQLRLLDILIEVDKLCRRHKIKYWLIAGSLLGAVRHEGFIPWDDDIDISILQKDLKKLKRILKKELPSQFVVQDNKVDKNYYIESVTQIRDKNSLTSIEHYKSFKEQGLFID